MSHESQFTLGPDKKELLSEGVYSDKFMCCLCGDMATCAAQPQPQFAFAVTTGLVYNWTMFTLLCLVLVGHLSNGYVKVFNHPNWFQMASNVTKSQQTLSLSSVKSVRKASSHGHWRLMRGVCMLVNC